MSQDTPQGQTPEQPPVPPVPPAPPGYPGQAPAPGYAPAPTDAAPTAPPYAGGYATPTEGSAYQQPAPPAGYAAPAAYAPPTGYAPGAAPQQAYPYPAPVYPAAPRTDPLAITALVCGIGGIVLSWTAVLWLASIAAIITGHIALRRLKSNGLGGRGLALTGTILGWASVGLGLLVIVFFVVIFSIGFAASTAPYSY